MIYLAALLIVLGVALFIAAPWFEAAPKTGADPLTQQARLEHERAQAVAALRELEFDHQMRKLSDSDFQELKAGLEGRALQAMAALEQLSAAFPRLRLAGRPRAAEPPVTASVSPAIRFCPSCGASQELKPVNFCAACGARLTPIQVSLRR